MNNIVGLKIKLDRPIDRDRPCCRNVCIISAGKDPHAGALHCVDCGQRRGWISLVPNPSAPQAHWEHSCLRKGASTHVEWFLEYQANCS